MTFETTGLVESNPPLPYRHIRVDDSAIETIIPVESSTFALDPNVAYRP